MIDKCPKCGNNKLLIFTEERRRYYGMFDDEESETMLVVTAWNKTNVIERDVFAVECAVCGFVMRDDDTEGEFLLNSDVPVEVVE